MVEQDAAEMLEGLRLLVTAYIEKPDGSGEVDWDWIVSRTMRDKTEWTADDRERHRRALHTVEQAKVALTDVVAIASDASQMDDLAWADIEADQPDDEPYEN